MVFECMNEMLGKVVCDCGKENDDVVCEDDDVGGVIVFEVGLNVLCVNDDVDDVRCVWGGVEGEETLSASAEAAFDACVVDVVDDWLGDFDSVIVEVDCVSGLLL